MTSPNEPGYPRATDGGRQRLRLCSRSGGRLGGRRRVAWSATGGSSPERTADATEVPPWQRGRAATGRRTSGRPDSPARLMRRGTEQRSDEPLPRHRCPAEPVPLRRLGVTAGAGPAGGQIHPSSPDGPDRRDPPRGRPARPDPPHRAARGPYASEIPDLPGRHRGRRRASQARSVLGRNRQAVPRLRRAERRRPAAIRARCGPACRFAGLTRGAC